MNAQRAVIVCASLIGAQLHAQQPGDLDNSFSGDGIATVHFAPIGVDHAQGLAIQPNGRIVVVGSTQQDLATSIALARYAPDGVPDPSFGGDGFVTIDITADDDAASDIALEPGGGILLTGYCGSGSDMGLALVRLDASGALDPSLAGDGVVIEQLSTDQDAGYTVLRQPADGKILVGGVTTFMPMVFIVVARYNIDGSLDNSFAGDGIFQSPHPGLNFPGNMVLAPDGRIVVGGTWATNFLVAVVNPDGTADTGFDDDGVVTTSFGQNAYGNDLALDPSGKAVLVGSSGQGATFNDFVVLRYHTGIDVGVDEAGAMPPSILISPNPVVGQSFVRLSLASPGRSSVHVIDAIGRAVRVIDSGSHWPRGERVLRFDADGLEPGHYQMVVSTSSGVSSLPFIVGGDH